MNTSFENPARPLLRKTLLRSFIVMAGIALMVSCKKGDTGPAGATGPAGPQGPAGSPNVVYTAWFTPTPWIKDTVFGIWGFNYTKAFPDLTQNVIDSGVVLTFGKLLGYNASIWPTNQIAQLPINLTYIQGQTMTDTWSSEVSAGKVKIRFVNDKNYWTSIATSHQFRVVIIPGGKAASTAVSGSLYNRNGKTLGDENYKANIQLVARDYQQMSYNEICDRLGIPRD